MKKFLSLVLALVMTMSLVTVSAGAKDFTDSSKITYKEAVDVMSAVKVIDGYAEGDFRPSTTLTRGAAAKIICNLILGPTTASALVADAAPYKDVPTNHTFAGYIAYCQKTGIISGYADGSFKPANSLTGYAFMKMLLGALGYKAEQEGYTGANWSIQVAKRALNIGLADDLVGDFNGVKAVTREEACLYAFNTLKATMVEYDKNSTVTVGNITIKEQSDAKDMANTGKTDGNIDKDGKMQFAEKYFEDLKKFGATDDFSRPATQWKIKAEEVGKYTDTPDLTYTKAVTECDVAHDAGLKVDTAYTLYVNGQKQPTTYTVNLTDTVTKMGAQGRLVEVYDDTIVMIDTFLAKVTYVAPAAYDAQGHLRTEATIKLDVYATKGSTAATTLTLTNGEDAYPYAVGDYVLLNAYTNAFNSATESGLIKTGADKYGEIVSKATSVDGAQTIIYWNNEQHNVAGTVYDDAVKFILDEAGNSTGNHTWFFDQYGNLIGNVEIAAATSYGVINSIWWVGNTADGSGVAKANVTYVDGTTAVLDISTLIYNGAAAENRNTTYIAKGGKLSHNTAALKVMSGDTYSTAPTSYFYIDDYIDQNARADKTGAQILNDDMFQFTTQPNGTVKAVEVSGAGTAAAYKNLHSENLAIYKDTQITSGLVANSNTVYLIRSGDDTTASPYTFKSVTGFDKIDRYQNDEVDYVMSDDFAKYVFIKADPTESKVTSVFFYAGEQASFNNETGVWTTPGYLDGEKTAIYAVGWNNSNVNTIIDTATGRGNANTIYSVALSNGYLDKDYTSAWVYTSTDPIRAASVNGVTYPLAAAYMNRNDVKVLTIQGSSSDTFEGNVYTHNDAKYSVVSNADFASKINSEFTNLGDKVIYLAYISGSGEYSGSILHANIVDRATTADELREISAVKPNGTVTAASSQSFKDITISNWDVTYTDGLTSGSTATVKTVNIEWYKLNEAGTEYNVKVVDTNAPFIAGNSYKFVATVELTGSNADDFTFADGANVYTGYVNNVQ